MNPYPLSVPPAPQGPLARIGVLVTRPARQAGATAARLAALGAAPIVFPAVAILPPQDEAPLARAHATLDRYDYAVFVSANAVEYGVPHGTGWPPDVVALAPGPSSAEALHAVGVENVRMPRTTFDSEGLLALPELADVRGRRVVVFRAEDGRELLGETLRARGAEVDYVPCYRRMRPASGAQGLIDAFTSGRIHAVSVTSVEGLDNLFSLVEPAVARAAWLAVPTFAGHPRIAAHARSLGLRAVETASGDAGLIAGLLQWFEPQRDADRR